MRVQCSAGRLYVRQRSHSVWRQGSFSLPLALRDYYACKADCTFAYIFTVLVEVLVGLHGVKPRGLVISRAML
jgi:hypothetical protein